MLQSLGSILYNFVNYVSPIRVVDTSCNVSIYSAYGWCTSLAGLAYDLQRFRLITLKSTTVYHFSLLPSALWLTMIGPCMSMPSKLCCMNWTV